MPNFRKGILAAVLAATPAIAHAQTPPVSDNLSITATKAWTWQENQTNVAQFDGPVQIELDNVRMSADSAVIWVTPTTERLTEVQQVEIALVGHAKLQHAGATRSGDRLFVTATVRGAVRVSAQDRLNRDRSAASVYQVAAGMRDQSGLNIRSEPGRWRLPRPSALSEPATRPAPGIPTQAYEALVHIDAGVFEQQKMPDGTMAFVIEKGLNITIRKGQDQVTQLVADRGVVFTTLKQFTNVDKLTAMSRAQEAAESVYLEGDVRVLFTPKSTRRPDVQLEANQVYYEIATDRAVLTDAVMHTMDPMSRIPVVIRARTMKQLSREEGRAEFRAEKSILTTSSFATPTYAVAADRAYIRQYESGDEWYGTRTDFSARNTTLDVWGIPIFWLPYTGGSVTDRGFPLRALDIGSSSKYGFFTRTTWGFFESIGRQPPRDLDLTYSVDYLADRGPAGGIGATYRGGYVTENTREPWSFEGDLTAYSVYDQGTDKYGADRRDVPADVRDQDFRGWVNWKHQQFLPDDWQVQLGYSWISDPGFLEEYYPDRYRGIEPNDLSFYVKHQRDTEALTLLVETQPNNFVTTQEFQAENLEVERMPELGYYRIGDSFADNSFSFFSANTASRLHFQEPHGAINDINAQTGYPSVEESSFAGRNYPKGLPMEGSTGVDDGYTDRGDFRQEVTYPITIDKFRVMPYVMGRYTGYSESPSGDAVDRGLGGGGVRITTEFWKVDDYAQSDLWDIHRVRHVIEPEINAFSSVGGTKPQDVFIYDEPVDDVSNISAVQAALHQRWQTKRGAPGKWQNVDFFTWNLEGNFFLNQPPDPLYINGDPARGIPPLGPEDPDPRNFRGLYFPSAPETSVARDSVNSDELWRVSDSTALLADQEYSLDASQLATESIGVAVRRGDRMTYYIGDRYINELDSNIASFLVDYELSTKYSLGMGQSYDFGDNSNVSSNFSVIRRFDRFYMAASVKVDDTTGDSGFFLSIRPSGMPSGIAAQNLPAAFSR